MQSGKNYYFEVGYVNNTREPLKNIIVSIDLIDEKGVKVLLLRNNFTNHSLSLNSDRGFIYCGVENFPLVYGLYRVSVYISHADRETFDYIEDAAVVAVDGGDFFGTGNPGLPNHCKFLVKANWSTEQKAEGRRFLSKGDEGAEV
jgi:lipopolysaccharide transport system ATP-binding protein